MKALCLAALFAVAGSGSAQSPADEPAIVAVVNGVFDGMRKADSASVRLLFHPRARLITVDARRTAPEIEESADAFIRFIGTARREVLDERISNVRVLIDGAMASAWAEYRLYSGTRFIHCGVDHFLLVKEDGKWSIMELADTRRTDC